MNELSSLFELRTIIAIKLVDFWICFVSICITRIKIHNWRYDRHRSMMCSSLVFLGGDHFLLTFDWLSVDVRIRVECSTNRIDRKFTFLSGDTVFFLFACAPLSALTFLAPNILSCFRQRHPILFTSATLFSCEQRELVWRGWTMKRYRTNKLCNQFKGIIRDDVYLFNILVNAFKYKEIINNDNCLKIVCFS